MLPLFQSAPRQGMERSFLATRSLDHAERPIRLDKSKAHGPSERIVEPTDLDQYARTRRKLERQPAVTSNLEVAAGIEMRIDSMHKLCIGFEPDRSCCWPCLDPERGRTLTPEIIHELA